MRKLSNTGRQRLRLLLGALSGGACSLAMAMTLIVYGAPYDPMWWWVMALILVAAFLAPALLILPIEWVIKGYREDKSG
jgi:hypothetical protein